MGAFDYKGTICLQPITGRLNAGGYCNLLSKAQLQKEGKRICGKRWVFQQDNAPYHKANHTANFLKDNKINVLQWPSCIKPVQITQLEPQFLCVNCILLCNYLSTSLLDFISCADQNFVH